MRPVYLFYTANNRRFPHFPEGVLALAGQLKALGYRPKIIDTLLTDLAGITYQQPLFVGFSILSNNGITEALEIASHFREMYPETLLVWGGPHVQMVPEQTAAHPLVDVACYGEGEETVASLAQVISDGGQLSEVPGIIYRNGHGALVRTESATPKDLDRLPPPPYEYLEEAQYPLCGGKIYYQTSRGCPFSCRFCSYTYQSRWRGKTAAKVISELKEIVHRFDPDEVYISDGNFFVKLQRVEEICQAFIREGFRFRWTCFCRFDTFEKMDTAFISLLIDAGCSGLNFGGESGSDAMLEYLNKRITRQQIVDGLQRATENGLGAEVSFLCGTPAETDGQLGKTLSLIDDIERRFPEVQINGLFHYQAYPNTPLMEEIESTYSIPLPRNLPEWAEKPVTGLRREYFPWLDDRRFSNIRCLTSIASYRYFYNKLISLPEAQRGATAYGHWSIRTLARLANVAVHPLVKLRWRKRFLRLPLEWRIWEMIRDGVMGQI